ncbi:MAG: winged helix-turn-helix domain-containing protein [archaeon]|jgi:DNA-binding transcriptional ArsR family regulator
MDNKITIDRVTLKAISSDTRMDILKQLDKKKKILSDLSTTLKLSNPTVKEHLEVLVKAGLVIKEESERKWKYYSLTVKGKQLLKPNETRLFLALVISIIGTTIFGLFMLLNSNIVSIGSSNNLKMTVGTTNPEIARSFVADSSNALITTAQKSQSVVSLLNMNNILLCFFIVIVIVILILYLKEKHK